MASVPLQFVAKGTTAYVAASGTTLPMTLPAGWLAGQLAIAYSIYWQGSGNGILMDAEAGWTKLDTTDAVFGYYNVTAFYRTLQGGDTDPTFDYSSARTNRQGFIVTYQGVTALTKLASYHTGPSGTTSATPTNASPAAPGLLLSCGGDEYYGGIAHSNAQGFTTRGVRNGANDTGSMLMSEKAVAAGSIVMPTFSLGGNSRLAHMSLLLT